MSSAHRCVSATQVTHHESLQLVRDGMREFAARGRFAAVAKCDLVGMPRVPFELSRDALDLADHERCQDVGPTQKTIASFCGMW